MLNTSRRLALINVQRLTARPMIAAKWQQSPACWLPGTAKRSLAAASFNSALTEAVNRLLSARNQAPRIESSTICCKASSMSTRSVWPQLSQLVVDHRIYVRLQSLVQHLLRQEDRSSIGYRLKTLSVDWHKSQATTAPDRSGLVAFPSTIKDCCSESPQ